MSRLCGIRMVPVDSGRRADGSEEAQLIAHMAGELPRDGEDPVASAALALKEAANSATPKDNIGIAIDTGSRVPLIRCCPGKRGSSSAWAESSLPPQWNIDVVADSLVLRHDERAERSDHRRRSRTSIPCARSRAILSRPSSRRLRWSTRR
jgi:hypothetical protein